MKILDFFHCSLPHSRLPTVSNWDCRITGKGGGGPSSSWWDKELIFSSHDRNTVLIKLSKNLKKREEKRAECGHQTGKPVSKYTGTRTVCWKQNFCDFHLLRDSPFERALSGCGHLNTEGKIKAEAWALVANVYPFLWNWEHWACISLSRPPPCVSSRPPDGVNVSRGMAPVLRGVVGSSFRQFPSWEQQQQQQPA